MAQGFERIYRGYGRFLGWLGILSGLITFGIMWLIDANALMRKLFNQPIQGSFEITEASLVLLVFLSLAYTQARRGHIRVTLLTRHLPMGVQHWLYVAMLGIAALFFAWCAYASFGYALQSYQVGEEEWGLVRFPLWPVKVAIFVGVLLTAIQYLLDAIRHALVAAGRLDALPGEP
ncbi:MAG: TRAP transporter small permease subunit [Gammaproteobacteria bacterium]|nr:TRAP transporter small permease subunit [Gammaproteobacteria bacterium]